MQGLHDSLGMQQMHAQTEWQQPYLRTFCPRFIWSKPSGNSAPSCTWNGQAVASHQCLVYEADAYRPKSASVQDLSQCPMLVPDLPRRHVAGRAGVTGWLVDATNGDLPGSSGLLPLHSGLKKLKLRLLLC